MRWRPRCDSTDPPRPLLRVNRAVGDERGAMTRSIGDISRSTTSCSSPPGRSLGRTTSSRRRRSDRCEEKEKGLREAEALLDDAMVGGVTGFEPAASSSRTTRATKLRHTRCNLKSLPCRGPCSEPRRHPGVPSSTTDRLHAELRGGDVRAAAPAGEPPARCPQVRKARRRRPNAHATAPSPRAVTAAPTAPGSVAAGDPVAASEASAGGAAGGSGFAPVGGGVWNGGRRGRGRCDLLGLGGGGEPLRPSESEGKVGRDAGSCSSGRSATRRVYTPGRGAPKLCTV